MPRLKTRVAFSACVVKKPPDGTFFNTLLSSVLLFLPLDQSGRQVGFGGKIAVHHLLGYGGLAGNGIHAGGVVTMGKKQLFRCVEDSDIFFV